jgi:predicted dehydrogenase
VWNPELPSPIDFQAGWQPVPDREPFDNAFKVQWELFLRHVVRDEPFPWDLLEAARGVQLAEAAHESWQQRRTIELGALRP